jgi:DNA primase
MGKVDFAAFDAAVNAYYGGISGLLVQECGCRIVRGSAGSANISLWCPNHGDVKKNLNGSYLHCNDAKGAWHCYKCENEGCHIAHEGYAVEAVMEYKHLDRKEAFKFLAQKVGFQSSNQDIVYRDKDIRSMYCNALHEELMAKYEKEPEFREAMCYLVSRGFNMETIKKHRVGYCSGFDAVNKMRRKGINDTQLEKAGVLARSKKSGKLYPAFSRRVTMMTGNNIYGRAVQKENTLRHFYTKDHNSIFNELCLGREWDKVFVVEAAFDAMSIEQYIRGLKANWCVIATCGTQGIKNADLANILKEECKPAEIVLIPDSDEWYNEKHERHAAGQRAGLAKARLFEAYGLKTRVVVLPPNSDPNDLTKTGVAVAQFEAMVQQALTPAKYAIYCEAHYHRYGEHSGNIGFLNEVRKSLGKYKVHLSADIIDYLALLTRENPEEIRQYLLPSLKKADCLDYIRSEVASGKNVDAVLAELKAQLIVQLPS